MADLDLPEEGETPWDLNPALESINAEVEGLLAMRVVVATGSEARPATLFVIWVGGATRPVNMIDGDLWFQDENATPPEAPTGTAPQITLTSLNALQVGSPFSQTITYTGDSATSANIISGAIPGVTVSRAGGTVTLSGTPTTAGSYTVTVQVSNGAGSDSQVFTGTVVAAPVAGGGTGSYLDRSTIRSPRNGTSTHSLSFTPADAGNYLVMVLEASAVITTPAGWTRSAQSLAGTDLSVFTKTATANESSAAITLSAANYHLVGAVYEFPAGTTWVNAQTAGNLNRDLASPVLSGLTGTVYGMAAVGTAHGSYLADNPQATWTGATLNLTVVLPQGDTDGSIISIGVSQAHTSATFSPAQLFTGADLPSAKEAITFAVRLP